MISPPRSRLGGELCSGSARLESTVVVSVCVDVVGPAFRTKGFVDWCVCVDNDKVGIMRHTLTSECGHV